MAAGAARDAAEDQSVLDVRVLAVLREGVAQVDAGSPATSKARRCSGLSQTCPRSRRERR
eukprot:7376808-Lingulodinium_polyedra.AAC.1